jgi:hypothetical protein
LAEPTRTTGLVDYVRSVEPPHTYLQDTSSSVVHHQDYLNRRDDQALCGVAFENPTSLAAVKHGAVCPDCEVKLVEYHLAWWREKAEAATTELDELRIKYRELVGADASGEVVETTQATSTAEQSEATPTTLLEYALRELLELCRQFENAVPYWRVKNSMDAFSDKLTADERVLLAQEIGADGSLIRWCTREIEGRGWQVTNSPVHADADTMMEAWTEDYYQTPKKTKKRLGWSR